MTPIITRDHMRCKRVEPESPSKSIKKGPASFFPGLPVESVPVQSKGAAPLDAQRYPKAQTTQGRAVRFPKNEGRCPKKSKRMPAGDG
jgi:hypothetical protein